MERYDPMNRTADDGAACAFCGEDATGFDRITTCDAWTTTALVPTCGDCHHDQITSCPDCQRVILQADGIRVFSAPDLYCPDCAKAYPHMQAGYIRELRDDERRGK